MSIFAWIKIGALLAIVGLVFYSAHRVTEHFREQGREEVRAEWAKDKEARTKLATDLALLAAQRLDDAEAAVKAEKEKSDARFRSLEERARRDFAAVPIVLPAGFGSLLGDITSAANGGSGAQTPGSGSARPAPVPVAPEAEVYDAADIGRYMTSAAEAYKDAKGLHRSAVLECDIIIDTINQRAR